jgi:predicted acetyltransferase
LFSNGIFEQISIQIHERRAAQAFWKRVLDHPLISKELQELASLMSGRIAVFCSTKVLLFHIHRRTQHVHHHHPH